MFYFDKINGQKILRSDLLGEVNAFFTTRNVNSCDLGFINGRLLSPNQTHSANVEIVDSKEEYLQTDGLILNNPKDTIYLKFADCTPLIFYDTKNKIGAISHAGWRGTAQKIGIKTVEKMTKHFNTTPEDLIVLIGPAIGICCYEVSEEVKETLLDSVEDKKGLFEARNIDLKLINARQLEEVGVRNIDICPYCTSCNNDLFYSYRKENGTTERHLAVLNLNGF